MERKATVKRAIKPVKLTVTVTASRVNENGTFSGFVVESVKGPNGSMKVACPPMGGGSIYIKTESLENLSFIDEAKAATTEKKKLF